MLWLKFLKYKLELLMLLSLQNLKMKLQQPYWDAMAFDDVELELLSNFGETIKFPSDNTAVRALSVLATFLLKHKEEFSYE